MVDEKQTFIDLLRSTKRAGIEDLIQYLENTDFFAAPASTKYHLSCEGGLLKHSLHVYYNLEKLCSHILPTDSIIIVSLLHDLCKANFYKKIQKNQKNKDGNWEVIDAYAVDELLPLGHGEKSVMLVQNYIKLTAQEILAIRWHMGGFEPKENYKSVNAAFQQSPLAIFLHMADLKATYVDEVEY